MDHVELGRRLRSRRAALGRTVASVATEAGLSVPYVANLENGRGNPTVDVLDRLADALGTRLVIGLADPTAEPAIAALPPSLVNFSQSRRFRREVGRLAAVLEEDHRAVHAMLVDALAAVGGALRRDLREADWQRLLDAVVLILGHPSE
ncbi:helix-turn-helix domain-containing protein [Microtetraspora malaysiensis]|uniref:helix-turn-helix domain-containing protein n=1 Tax=Microtetraspora malaysiensis TaxID=161358 RepID=UPI000833C97B|nr:helix-turn-helix domain-containing protein [Microtetraspora malaysiensis]